MPFRPSGCSAESRYGLAAKARIIAAHARPREERAVADVRDRTADARGQRTKPLARVGRSGWRHSQEDSAMGRVLS
jgi:hypothetical protein